MLKRIEIAGFKSFGKKTSLEFTSPVTSVVGPNGSGKSNIVEAIRFVLGEQSMKSLRGKAGTDLIFKGSKGVSAPSRASVVITFDNTKKSFAWSGTSEINIDFDEVSIGREVYSDGANRYLINGSEVRLKDVVELLASVHIGSSGHHIISQGEADRILNSSSKDRRAMIEDALGLKVYQYKIKESERKLERTLINMKEVESLRREIAPHIKFLKKQVEKIEKANQMREELGVLYKEYFARESFYIKKEKNLQSATQEKIESELKVCNESLSKFEKNRENSEHKNTQLISDLEKGLAERRSRKAEMERTIGRLEGMIEAFSGESHSSGKSVTITEADFTEEIENLIRISDEIISSGDIVGAKSAGGRIKESLNNLRRKFFGGTTDNNRTNKKEELKKELTQISSELRKIEEEEKDQTEKLSQARVELERELKEKTESEKHYYELLAKRGKIEGEMQMAQLKSEQLARINIDFTNELKEAGVLVGREAINFVDNPVGADDRVAQEELRKNIERIKIKLEDAGGGGAEVMKEYEETSERDTFLGRELDDLKTSIGTLRELIGELKTKLDADFKNGVEKINKTFEEFFKMMFGGGSAYLTVTVEHKKLRKPKDEDEESLDEFDEMENEEGELGFERGIEINVSLPQKKVKDLHMLSGGERSLTSIALLFAMSQVNPPPFLVLDETDAALDENNSRKYGDMLVNLSKYSQLIVVTHNRETMSRAYVLYGVTMGSDGSSKLLSIKFDEATSYAK